MEKEQVLSGLLIRSSSGFLLMDHDTFLTHTGLQAASSVLLPRLESWCCRDTPALCRCSLTPCWHCNNKITPALISSLS